MSAKLRDTIEFLTLLLLGVAGISISLFDGFILPTLEALGVKIPPELISRTILVIVGAIAAYLALERRSKLDKIEGLLLNSYSHIEAREINNAKELYTYVAERILNARRIRDVSWGPNIVSTFTKVELRAFKGYRKAIETACIRKDSDILYQEVFSFPGEDRLIRLKELIHNPKCHGYNAGCFVIMPDQPPPLLQFMIIDSDELVLTFFHSHEPSNIHLLIRHRPTVALFESYYTEIWDQCTKIKEAGHLYTQTLETLE